MIGLFKSLFGAPVRQPKTDATGRMWPDTVLVGRNDPGLLKADRWAIRPVYVQGSTAFVWWLPGIQEGLTVLNPDGTTDGYFDSWRAL